MADNDSSQEKTEDPTPKRLRESREKGQVPRSKDFNTMMMMVVGSAGLMLLGPGMMEDLLTMFREVFIIDREQTRDISMLVARLQFVLTEALAAIAPFLILMLLAMLLPPIMMGGWVFSGKSLAPKISKLNPIKGLARIYSTQGLMELVKAIAKFLVVAGFASLFFFVNADQLMSLGRYSLGAGLSIAADMILWSLIIFSAGLVIIAAIDVPFQLWSHNKKLKMSLQEVKDEMKETEGKPEVKGRIRQLQREMANNRMMQDVPQADVIITNPTHYAIALKYDPETMRTPILLAKGTDELAKRIREVGEEHGITLVAAPPLARALYASTEVQQPIPAPLFVAVAQVLAFVFQLKQARRAGERAPQAPKPEVPQDFLDAYGVAKGDE